MFFAGGPAVCASAAPRGGSFLVSFVLSDCELILSWQEYMGLDQQLLPHGDHTFLSPVLGPGLYASLSAAGVTGPGLWQL